MKALIFTEQKVGEGHFQAAKALQEAILNRSDCKDAEVKIMNGLRCIHPRIEWLTVMTYFGLLHRLPGLWRYIYTKTERSSFLLTYFFALRLEVLLQIEQPDIVFCTHPACVPALSKLKREGKMVAKWAVVTTDYDFHPFIISSYVDEYFVAHHGIKNRMINLYQIEGKKIHVFGIPLRNSFNHLMNANQINRLDIKSEDVKLLKRFKILLLGGSTGYGQLEEILDSINRMKKRKCPIDVSVVTGRNKQLFDRLLHRFSPKCRILGYCQNMHEEIQSADVVITKPGGLTVTESIACGTPMLLINPIPGHEEANCQFLQEEGIGRFIRKLEHLPAMIEEMMLNEKQYNEWVKRIYAFQQRDTAHRIINHMLLN
jgi:processive 1,2-diacylglycerol beta-glucosyltransferase